MKNINEKPTSEEVKLKASVIRKNVGNLLIYMDDERKDYECCLEDDPTEAKTHVWLDIKAIADWIGLTEDEAWELYKKK